MREMKMKLKEFLEILGSLIAVAGVMLLMLIMIFVCMIVLGVMIT